MQAHEAGERLGSLPLFDLGITLGRFEEPVTGTVEGVILQHVEDETFLDGLAAMCDSALAAGALVRPFNSAKRAARPAASSRHAAHLREERIHDVLTVAEICPFDPVESVGEIEKALLCSEAENTQSTGRSESPASGCGYTLPVVHQDQVGVKFEGKRDGIFLACVEITQRGVGAEIGDRAHFDPGRRTGDPGPDEGGCRSQLFADDRG